MTGLESLKKTIFLTSEETFEGLAVQVFHYQAEHNPVYRKFLDLLKTDISMIRSVHDIPFLPISFFKTHEVVSGRRPSQLTFTSSGTTGILPSRHFIADVDLYRRSFTEGFELRYGPVESHCFLGLLPSYLERSDSSLVFMVNEFINRSRYPQSGFYLDELEQLAEVLIRLNAAQVPTILLGVSFALLDLADRFPVPIPNVVVMETGGMKGRRKELTRAELHQRLKTAFAVHAIHSEYGMTELLSQAYSESNGSFVCPPWMNIYIRDPYDPLSLQPSGATGAISVVDLSNIHSCAFIATDDLGKKHKDGSFEVLGRIDGSDLRGCNLMV